MIVGLSLAELLAALPRHEREFFNAYFGVVVASLAIAERATADADSGLDAEAVLALLGHAVWKLRLARRVIRRALTPTVPPSGASAPVLRSA